MRRPSTGFSNALCGLGWMLASGAAGADIQGCWISEAGDSVIEMTEDAGAIRGRVVGLAEPLFLEGEGRGTPGQVRVDLNNPDIELRARALAGMFIVEDLVPDGEIWIDGRIYDPRSGKSYSARASLDDGVLKIRGYVAVPMFGLTTRWTDADAEVERALAMIEKLEPWMPKDAMAPYCIAD